MSRRMAFNPLPWMMTVDGWRPDLAPSLPVMLAAIKKAGYDGVHAEIPQRSTPKAYLSLLSDHGLDPAPGYFQASFGDLETIKPMGDESEICVHILSPCMSNVVVTRGGAAR